MINPSEIQSPVSSQADGEPKVQRTTPSPYLSADSPNHHARSLYDGKSGPRTALPAPIPVSKHRASSEPAQLVTPCSNTPRSPVRRRAEREEKAAGYLPLSRTTDRVLAILLEGDLYRLRAESVAESLGISCTTLRRRLRNDHTSYQFLLDRARQYRCEAHLRERWLPGKCMADELGYLEVNSFYRAFRRWTGISYSTYRTRRGA